MRLPLTVTKCSSSNNLLPNIFPEAYLCFLNVHSFSILQVIVSNSLILNGTRVFKEMYSPYYYFTNSIEIPSFLLLN
jgi:hypothetical protein